MQRDTDFSETAWIWSTKGHAHLVEAFGVDILLPHGSAQPRAHEQGAEGSVSWQGLPGKPGLEGPQGPVGMYVSAVAAQEPREGVMDPSGIRAMSQSQARH